MGECASSPRLRFCLWRSRRKREDDKQISEKSGGISVKNAYYGDYGMDENIYGENGFFARKKHERLVKKAMEEQENAVVKVVKKKGLSFGVKRREK